MFEQKWSKIKPPKGVLLNRGHPLAKDLVGCWLAQEGSGNKAIDISGNNYHATFAGTCGWRLTPMGTAFDSQSSYNNPGTTPFNGSEYNTLSIEAWFITDAVDAIRYIVDNSPGSVGYMFRINGDDLQFYTFEGDTPKGALKANCLTTGVLYHAVGTHGASNKLYLNGNLVGGPTACSPDITDTTDKMAIGGEATGSYGWDGALILIRVWNRELTQNDVTNLYTNPYGMFDKARLWGAGEAGPTNLKSVNGVLLANIKSINGVAIANVKSVNGIT